MAATDVKDIFLKTETSGEVWLYKRLCNGTEIAVVRVCCDDDPNDPGNVPDPPIAAEICRVANGMSEQLQIWIERLAELMTEQPNNQFGDFAAASAWSLELYGLLGEPGPIAEIVAAYSADETDIYAGTQDAAFLQLLVCAVYRAIAADPNGINLSPSIADNIAVILAELQPDPPDAEVTLAVGFGAALMPYFRLATLKRWAYDASIVDPGTVTDLDCEDCVADPEAGDCTADAYTWNLVNETPAGWAQIGALPTVDLGNVDDEFDRCPNLQATRSPFGDWVFAGTIASDGVQCIGIKKTFGSPCKITKAGVRFVSDSQASKAAVIYVKVGATYTMISGTFDQAPAPNTFQVTYQGGIAGIEDVEEIHFALFTGSSNPSLSLNLKVTATSINADLPPV